MAIPMEVCNVAIVLFLISITYDSTRVLIYIENIQPLSDKERTSQTFTS